MKKKTIVVVAIAIALIVYALRRPPIPTPVSGVVSPQPAATIILPTVVEVPIPGPVVIPPAPIMRVAVFDPFPLLEQQHQAALSKIDSLFDIAEGRIRAAIEPDRDAAYRDYLIDFDVLNKSNMEAEQKKAHAAQLEARYREKAYALKDKVRVDLDRIAVQRRAAIVELGAEKVDKRIRLEHLKAMVDGGQSDIETAVREQLRILGISLPRSALDTAGAAERSITPKVGAVIAAADNRLCALIGDTLAEEGDTVQGYRVWKIRADSVEFEKDGKTWIQPVN